MRTLKWILTTTASCCSFHPRTKLVRPHHAAVAAAPWTGGICTACLHLHTIYGVHRVSVWTHTHTHTRAPVHVRTENTAGGIPVAAFVHACLCVQTRKQICTSIHAASPAARLYKRVCTCAIITPSQDTYNVLVLLWLADFVWFCSADPGIRNRQTAITEQQKSVLRCMHVDKDTTFRSDLDSEKRSHVHATRHASASDPRASHNGYLMGIL